MENTNKQTKTMKILPTQKLTVPQKEKSANFVISKQIVMLVRQNVRQKTIHVMLV